MKIPHIGEKLNTRINGLLRIKPARGRDYYFFSLFADAEGKFHYDYTSHWVGFTDSKPRREIRDASLVDAPALIKGFRKMKQPVFVINTLRDLQFYFIYSGGYAVVQKRIARKYLKDWIAPGISVHSYDGGFEAIHAVPEEKLNRRPSWKLRTRVLKRDDNRCRLCGASPKKNKHVLLEVHHITPYSMAGVTDENNLITLCRVCHNKLKPHYDPSLFSKIGVEWLSKRIDDQPYLKRLQWNVQSAMIEKTVMNLRIFNFSCSTKRYDLLDLMS